MIRSRIDRAVARLREAARDTLRDDRGDVPGWVLITLMTAGLVIVIWAIAGPALSSVFQQAIDRVIGFSVLRVRALLRDDSCSATADFVMVGALLTVLTLSVMQLGLALHIRNTVTDAASEGARFG